MGRLLRAPVQFPRSSLFRHRGPGHGREVEGDDQPLRQDPHPGQRGRRREGGPDPGIPGPLPWRGHPARGARLLRPVRHGGCDARQGREAARHRGHLLRVGGQAHSRPWRERRRAEEAQNSHRRQGGRAAAADLLGEPARPHLLRIHPEERRRRLRRRQLQGAVRVDRAGPDAPRRGQGKGVDVASKLKYQAGFGNTFATEAVRGTLPVGQNSPQRPPRGLYPEVLSFTAFTAPRAENLSSWVYRLRPSAMQAACQRMANGFLRSGPFSEIETPPNRLRWNPLPIPAKPTDFIDGLTTIAGSGDPAAQSGLAVHVYRANRSMTDRYFANADGELMIVPQLGSLLLFSELGKLEIRPGEIALI